MNFKIEPRKDRMNDGLCPFRLKVGTGERRQYVALNFSANPIYWDVDHEIFVIEKGVKSEEAKERNKVHKEHNAFIDSVKTRCAEILTRFKFDGVDEPTITQFVDQFTTRRQNNITVAEYFNRHISELIATNHVGNSNCYYRTLYMLRLFCEKEGFEMNKERMNSYKFKFDKLLFPDINLKFVNSFDVWLQKRGCKGNTRKYYHKALRALLNKAIKEKEASENTYPYGKKGFEVAGLEEETAKRYLPISIMDKIKTTPLENFNLEVTRRIFVAQYLCFGISWIDAGCLTTDNIQMLNSGKCIVYKRQKTKNAKRVKPIVVTVTDELQSHLDWFADNCRLIDNHLFPIVSIEGYTGERLYNHIRSRFTRNNKYLKKLAECFEITDMPLTSYVSRHTMAMKLQTNKVSREKISQMLGHNDISTTQTYLDSFDAETIAEAAELL